MEEEEQLTADLVDVVDEYVSTDVISDLKSGIYNLFVSLVDYYTIDYGPVKGADEACKYLERLVAQVREVLDTPNQNI
jgi:hypothetical protein